MPKELTSPKALRIQEALLHKSLKSGKKESWNSLAAGIGQSTSAPTNWKKGHVSQGTMELIADYLGVSAIWLLTGQGSITAIDQTVADNEDLIKIGRNFVKIIELEQQIKELRNKVAPFHPSAKRPPLINQKDFNNLVKAHGEIFSLEEQSHQLYAEMLEIANSCLQQK